MVLSGTIVMLNFRYERQFSASLEEEVNRQKEKLQKSEARYQGLVENAADLIYTVDDDGRILSINRYAANLFSLALAGSANPRPEAGSGRLHRPHHCTTFLPRNPRTSTWNGCGR